VASSGWELAAGRPDVFRPDLAMSLNNLSVRLGDLGGGMTHGQLAGKQPASSGS